MEKWMKNISDNGETWKLINNLFILKKRSTDKRKQEELYFSPTKPSPPERENLWKIFIDKNIWKLKIFYEICRNWKKKKSQTFQTKKNINYEL